MELSGSRSLLVMALIATSAAAVVEAADHREHLAFIDFSARYGRSYAQLDEHNQRFEVFKKTLRTVEEHNDKRLGWQMGINAFSDMTYAEFQAAYGMKEEHQREHHRLQSWHSKSARSERYEGGERDAFAQRGWDANNYEWLDAQDHCITADWLDSGKVGHPKQQGKCGSCYAHSSLAAIETLAAQKKETLWMSEVPVYSEQQIVDCTMVPNFGCFGGDPKHSFDYAKTHGLAFAKDYPYKDKFQKCTYDEASMKAFQLEDFKIFSYPLKEDLAKLVCHGAVSVGFFMNDCIKNYSGGILTDFSGECGCSQQQTTNHAVAIVGFGVDGLNEACKKFWLVKNSWGRDWGEHGFMRICRDDDVLPVGTCSIRSEAVLPWGGKQFTPKTPAKAEQAEEQEKVSKKDSKKEKKQKEEDDEVDENPWHKIPHHHRTKQAHSD